MPASNAAYEVRQMTASEFAAIARIHCAAFSDSGLSALGESVVTEYYRWQLARVRGAHSIVACSGQSVAGYAICGDTLDSTARFLLERKDLVGRALLRRPWIVADRRFLRFLTYAARLIVPRHARPSNSASAPAPSAKRFWVEVMAVDPAVQGAGLGTMMLSACEQLAAAQGFAECFLAVDLDNVNAIRLYKRLGWEPVPNNGIWKGRMRKTLLTVNAGARSTTYSAC